MDERDNQLIRRYASYIRSGLSLNDAKKIGFVQDASDEEHWTIAAEDPEFYTKGNSDTEIVDPAIYDETVLEDMMGRIQSMIGD